MSWQSEFQLLKLPLKRTQKSLLLGQDKVTWGVIRRRRELALGFILFVILKVAPAKTAFMALKCRIMFRARSFLGPITLTGSRIVQLADTDQEVAFNSHL